MQEISRRTVLIGTASATMTLGLPASTAHAKPVPVPMEEEALGPSACGTIGSTDVCLTVQQVQDGTGIRYTLMNGGSQPASYTVSYVDVDGGPEASPRTVSVGAGDLLIGYFYGDLLHCFSLHVCQEGGGDCLTLGPLCANTTSGIF